MTLANDNVNTFANLAFALAEETGIDEQSAGKVVTWLISEGVLDAPVVNDTFNDTEVGLSSEGVGG